MSSSKRSCAASERPPAARRQSVHHSDQIWLSLLYWMLWSKSVHNCSTRHSSSGWPKPGRMQKPARLSHRRS